jgi:hypothetical protein
MKEKLKNTFPHKKKLVAAFIVLFTCCIGPLLLSQGKQQSTVAPMAATESFWLWNFLGHLHPVGSLFLQPCSNFLH